MLPRALQVQVRNRVEVKQHLLASAGQWELEVQQGLDSCALEYWVYEFPKSAVCAGD